MTDKPISINSIESNTESKKSNKFIENTKRAVGKVLTTTGIFTGSLGPVTTPSVVPTSINTITAIAPIASTTIKTISLGTATGLFVACSKTEGPEEIRDTTPPSINISQTQIDITGGKQIQIIGNQLYLGNETVASRTDNISKNCNVSLTLNGKPITSGTTISEEGTLTIKVTDEAGNYKNADVKLNVTKNAPSITVNQYEINISGGIEINIKDNQLLFGENIVASRNDDNLESCKITLSFNGQEIKPGITLNDSGILTITITNKHGISSKAEITLTNEVIYGLENLQNASIQVDKEINLLNGITFAEGIELVKTEIEIDNQRNTIDPLHYTPNYPGTCSIIFTIKGKNGNTTEIKVDNLTIKPLEYKSMELTNVRPIDILPIIGQIESGDTEAYSHIEHLRIAEATKIRDMMWNYGAGNHSAEEYQKLMSRLHTGMTMENPKGYNNYEAIGGEVSETGGTNHAHDERNILNTLISHANFNVVDPINGNRHDKLYEIVKSNSNKIYIFGNSAAAEVDKPTYLSRNNNAIKNLCKSKNFLIFVAGGNIKTKNGKPINKIYHEDIDGDESGRYSLPSSANGKNDSHPDRHLIVTIGTNANGDIDQTNEKYSSSKFPVGFHNDVLFAGRTFPHKSQEGEVEAGTGKYATSYVTYTNVAIADLCFQMFAEVKNVDELLNMIKSSTDLRDHIRFNGEDQPLILMNPAGFFQKYLMPTDLASNIQSGKAINLNKGYYKGIVFDIPGAEVKINGEWVAYNEANKSLIKSQNPMNLQWRINGDLCRKLGYKGKNIEGKIVVVDDKWNGLNIKKDISINFSN